MPTSYRRLLALPKFRELPPTHDEYLLPLDDQDTISPPLQPEILEIARMNRAGGQYENALTRLTIRCAYTWWAYPDLFMRKYGLNQAILSSSTQLRDSELNTYVNIYPAIFTKIKVAVALPPVRQSARRTVQEALRSFQGLGALSVPERSLVDHLCRFMEVFATDHYENEQEAVERILQLFLAPSWRDPDLEVINSHIQNPDRRQRASNPTPETLPYHPDELIAASYYLLVAALNTGHKEAVDRVMNMISDFFYIGQEHPRLKDEPEEAWYLNVAFHLGSISSNSGIRSMYYALLSSLHTLGKVFYEDYFTVNTLKQLNALAVEQVTKHPARYVFFTRNVLGRANSRISILAHFFEQAPVTRFLAAPRSKPTPELHQAHTVPADLLALMVSWYTGHTASDDDITVPCYLIYPSPNQDTGELRFVRSGVFDNTLKTLIREILRIESSPDSQNLHPSAAFQVLEALIPQEHRQTDIQVLRQREEALRVELRTRLYAYQIGWTSI